MTDEQIANKAIADAILMQIGGRAFKVMTGATHFIAGNSSLTMSLPSRFAKDGINRVTITLDDNDTYSMTFQRIRGLTKPVTVAIIENVYDNMLAPTFREVTGLETRAPRFVKHPE